MNQADNLGRGEADEMETGETGMGGEGFGGRLREGGKEEIDEVFDQDFD